MMCHYSKFGQIATCHVTLFAHIILNSNNMLLTSQFKPLLH